MYCPRCSQEQVSDDLRFCPRCGLPLDLVSEVVESGGTPERLVEMTEETGGFSRRNGLIASLVWFLLFIVFIVPLSLLADAHEDLVAVFGMLGFFGAVITAMFSVFLGTRRKTNLKKSSVDKKTTQRAFTTAPSAKVLESAKTQSANEYISPAAKGHSYETGKMAQPSRKKLQNC